MRFGRRLPRDKGRPRAWVAAIEASGLWLPIWTPLNGNIDSIVAFNSDYFQIGDVVFVMMRVTVDPTALNVQTRISFTLPVAPAPFLAASDLIGVAPNARTSAAANSTDIAQVRSIIGDVVGELEIRTQAAGARAWKIPAMYRL